MKLYPDQARVVNDTREAFAQGATSVCMQSATGSGKTVMAGHIAVQAMQRHHEHKGVVVAFLVHRRELVKQAVKTLTTFGLGEHIGVIAPWAPVVPWKPIQVAMIPTLARREKLVSEVFSDVKLKITDEAHHVRAKTWEEVIRRIEGWHLGLTATPSRPDGKGLDRIFDALVVGDSYSSLVKEARLAPIKVLVPNTPLDRKKVPVRMGDFSIVELERRMTGPVIASSLKTWLEHASDRRTIHFAITRRHSKKHVQGLLDAGVSAVHLSGITPDAERDDAMRRFESGAIQVISNVGLFTEGVDAPDCDCVHMDRPTKSIILWLQANGRMSRPKADGRNGLCIDGARNSIESNLGHPEDPVDWSLEEGAGPTIGKQGRRAASTHRLCGGCRALTAAASDVCEHCGIERQTVMPTEIEVEMEELARGAIARKARQAKRKGKLTRRELSAKVIATGGDMDRLTALAEQYGYSPYAVQHWIRIYGRAWGGEEARLL